MKNKNIRKLKTVSEEILGEEDLIQMLESNESLNHYIGFEISGLIHLGTGIMSMLVVKQLQELGVSTSIWLADWHTWINNKLGGDREFIEKVAKEYFALGLLASAQIVGADPNKIKVRFGSEQYHDNDRFWESLVDISKNLSLSRVIKSTTITGRNQSSSMPFAQLIYPPLQVADIFELKANIAHAGMDQRKAHVIAREVAKSLIINPLLDKDENKIKPIAIHHHLLLGLQKPHVWPVTDGIEKNFIRTEMKMSKSIPGSAIFIHDSEEEIVKKVSKAFCPEKEIELNPIIDWVEHIIFPIKGQITIKREERHGGTFTANSIMELKERYASGELFSLDLKNALANDLIELLTFARETFSSPEKQQLIKEIVIKTSR